MEDRRDLYAILQVDPYAEAEVIQAAYRRLAAKYHPDVNRSPDAVQRMQELNAAYDTLSDPAKRAAYDARRGRALWPEGGSGFPPAVDVRRLARQLFVPVGIFLFFLLAPRVGPKAALVMTGLLLLLAFYLIWQRR